MIFEASRRRESFTDGIGVILGDGQRWTLPSEWAAGERAQPSNRRQATAKEAAEAELRALLGDAWESETESDARRCDLALAIHLLRKNYDLGPDELQELLGFTADSAEGRSLRGQLRSLIAEAHRRRAPASHLRPERPHRPGMRSNLQGLWGRLRARYQRHLA